MNRTTKIVIIFCGICLLTIYCLDLRKDYYYHFTKRKTNAEIKDLKKTKGLKPYIITIEYFNEDFNKRINHSLKLDEEYGETLSKDKVSQIPIFYTKASDTDFYLVGYKNPTVGSFILDVIIFLLISSGVIFLFIDLFKSN